MRSPVRFWPELSSSQRRFEPLSSGSPGQGKAELAVNMRAVATRQPPNLALRKVKMSWNGGCLALVADLVVGLVNFEVIVRG